MTDRSADGRRPATLADRLGKDRIGAALLVVMGASIATLALTYRMGTATRMGPGYMPFFYGVLMVLVGLAIGVAARGVREGDRGVAAVNWRGWLCILGALIAFAIIGVYGGLVPATFIAVFLAAMGSAANSARTAALLATGLVIAAVLIFSYGLKLQFALFAWG
ncbi:tripartite tricarboxylate transporter TctB family protein [Bradyrhizobium iriomotense]|uniref:tripartite tricarboxylate transporter TctB family protein n=1 Tax=Bradyrhizobium iriomotense TaxID=441950 RepID=UPI001B8A8A83|nr:tripartite tricarboxylate transporter TctB family protein [Bradyrhizobium iriomotense]MBR0782235.1 tripartite tricarboxylate transporter TctB family protein [Bradyrhizobium iriomotense]